MSNKKIEKNESLKYAKIDQITHVLKRPGTYIGSIDRDTKYMYVCEDNNLNNFNIVKKEITYTPAFIKIFDEILVNASDHSIRTGTVKYIKINFNEDNITVENDGQGIPIEIHPIENVYNPELIFCNLLSGENYDDEQERQLSGYNGLGSKTTSIYSSKFIVECCDGKKKYKQVTTENMRKIGKPTIKDAENSKSYTKITYYPEFERFNMREMEDDSLSLMIKRCIDIAAYNPTVKVSVNGKTIPVKSMKDYMKMHLPPEADMFYEELANGWYVGIAKSLESSFEQVSICNGTATYRGSTAVTHVANQLAKDISDKFSKKIKSDWKTVKEKLFLFVISAIPNPDFDTQTKECMTKYLTVDIHKNAYVSETTVKKIMKSEIVKSILDEIEVKEKMALKRLHDKNKKVKIKKLIDAKSKNRSNCECFIFEGDSAGDGAIKFLDNQTQGIFKLRGKFDNVRKMSDKQILQSENAMNMMKALGLTLNSKIKPEDLRYNKVIISTDMDSDGDAIFALLLNFFSKWRELFDMGIIYRCLTPLLVIKKGKDKKYFYTNKEWEEYQKKNSLRGYEKEYKKGLGSLEDEEYKEMIHNPKLMQVLYDDLADDKLDIWFNIDTEKRKNELK